MKKFRKYLMLLLVATLSLTFTSCGGNDDEPDDKNNPSTDLKTDYGIVKATGVKTMSIFLSAKDGETVLNIPGFAPIRIQGHYNVYTRVIDNILFYAEGDIEFANWMPGKDLPSKFSDTESFGYDTNIIVRVKSKDSNNYAYAYLSKVRYLEEATGEMKGSLMGCVIKYTSPIDPESFTDF